MTNKYLEKIANKLEFATNAALATGAIGGGIYAGHKLGKAYDKMVHGKQYNPSGHQHHSKGQDIGTAVGFYGGVGLAALGAGGGGIKGVPRVARMLKNKYLARATNKAGARAKADPKFQDFMSKATTKPKKNGK